MDIAFLPARELEQSFCLSPAGIAEIAAGVTDLPRCAVELMFRLDGEVPLLGVRDAMTSATPAEFASAFNALRQGGLVQVAARDPFQEQAALQLQRMGVAAVSSGQDRGSRLSVGLVCRQPLQHRPADRPLWAVVVEDDEILLRFLQQFLTLGGLQVRTASNKAEVVEVVRQGVPDIFILDGTLPDVDGFDILRSIRRHPQLGAVPALMMTGRARRKDVLDAFASGAQGYLTKPVDAETLIAGVRAVLGMPAEGPGGGDPWSNRDALPGRTPGG